MSSFKSIAAFLHRGVCKLYSFSLTGEAKLTVSQSRGRRCTIAKILLAANNSPIPEARQGVESKHGFNYSLM